MNEHILNYIEEYRKLGGTHTSNVEIKSLIVDYLNSKNESFKVYMNDKFQYIITKV